jgi:hypothetical protein
LTGRTQRRKNEGTTLSPLTLEANWADLLSDDAGKAYHAVQSLTGVPAQTLPFLQQRLRPVAVLTPGEKQHVTQLLAHLDSDRFEQRQKATREIESLGESARPQIRAFLETKPSLEARQRAEHLLGKVQGWTSERLRILRAVEVLEHIGDASARTLLKKLSQGAATALVTEEAKASLARLDGAGRGK